MTATMLKLAIPLLLALLAGGLTYLLRAERQDGTVRPHRERLSQSAIVSAVFLPLLLFVAWSPTWFAVFFTIWWTVLFATLPFGVRGQGETGEAIVMGTEAGAPQEHGMVRKLVITTALSLPLLLLVIFVVRTAELV
jgi:predicted secreted protein